MFSKTFSAAAAALVAAQMVSAQTFTSCNPMEKTCPDDPALGTTATVDFTKGTNDLFQELDGTSLTYDDAQGAVFTINKETEAPTIETNKWIFFGKIDVTLKASTGQGVVTSFVLQSDDLDEIDWEWLGGDTTQVQTNYFGKGDTTTYDRGAYHPVNSPQDDFHTYTIDWTKDYVKWYIDGDLVRTLLYADAKDGTRFPQTPMQIKLGTWVAGRKDAPEGTVEWAGGYTDFTKAPFVAYYKSITIQDYSNGVDGATYYSWSEGSDGSYESINVLTSGDDANATKSDTASSTGGDKTTMSTATITSAGGLTQATMGSDTNVTLSATGTETIATSATGFVSTVSATGTSTSTSSYASGTSSSATSGAMQKGANLALVGASVFLGYLVL
ncbi:glycoside hydrolase family 16 protein [Pestalotiopsis sp. NC0098]|nr:glycoside hydrolase family 16 protein [Pestalotiopsis sp. NC0098]